MSVQVTPAAVFDRVNHALEKKGTTLVKCEHRCQACLALGDYYLMDSNQNTLIDTNVDLEKIAREEDCLAVDEEISTDQA